MELLVAFGFIVLVAIAVAYLQIPGWLAVIGCGIFYIICITVQTWGFGADADGAKAFAASGARKSDSGAQLSPVCVSYKTA